MTTETLHIMKPQFLIPGLSAALSVTLLAAVAFLASGGALAAPPQKVTLQYDISRNGTVMVEVAERLEHDGKTYTLVSDGKGKGMYAMVRSGAVKRMAKGTVTPAGLRPDEFHDKRGDRPEKTARFDWAKGTLQQGEEGKSETKPMPTPERLTDRLSFLWSFAFKPPVGKEVFYVTSDGGGLNDFRFTVAGTETIKTGAGDIEALKLVKVRDAGDDRGTEVWLATKQHYLPVRILVIEKDGTRIDQVVTSISTQ
jgi:hypothetical protein